MSTVKLEIRDVKGELVRLIYGEQLKASAESRVHKRREYLAKADGLKMALETVDMAERTHIMEGAVEVRPARVIIAEVKGVDKT